MSNDTVTASSQSRRCVELTRLPVASSRRGMSPTDDPDVARMLHPVSARAKNDRPLAAGARAGRVDTRLLAVMGFSTPLVINPAPADKSSRDGRPFLAEGHGAEGHGAEGQNRSTP